jgi:hypothetical protein
VVRVIGQYAARNGSRLRGLLSGRILPLPSVPFGRQWGSTLPGGDDVDLSIGRELLGLALLVGLLCAVMWLLASTRRSPQ